jgi:hypothetical protein
MQAKMCLKTEGTTIIKMHPELCLSRVSIAKRQKTIKDTTRQISFRNVRPAANIIENLFRIICKLNISSSSVRFMPFSCNSTLNRGKREGHLKTTLTKACIFYLNVTRRVKSVNGLPPTCWSKSCVIIIIII